MRERSCTTHRESSRTTKSDGVANLSLHRSAKTTFIARCRPQSSFNKLQRQGQDEFDWTRRRPSYKKNSTAVFRSSQQQACFVNNKITKSNALLFPGERKPLEA